MEQYQKKQKKRNHKPLYMLGIFLIVFGVFIYFLIKPSVESTAIEEVQNAVNAEEIHSSWEKNRAELSNDDDYLTAVRTKLSSFNLSFLEIQNCLKWLPKAPQSLNIIVVPDLSGRINDTINNPGQVKNDTTLLNEVWKSFESATKLKINSKDRLVVDVTGGDQAQGQFRSIANNLIFDLSGNKDKSNKFYFPGKQLQFQSNVAQLYNMARQNPQGADYWSYFNNDLKENMRASTLFTDYRNLLIILTDGYLEAQSKEATGTAFYTGSYGQRLAVFNQLRAGQAINSAVSSIPPIMDCSTHFNNLEVLILEVNERHSTSGQEPVDKGTRRDKDILKKLWTDWFTKLEIKNASGDFFNVRLDATDLTKQKIRDFIKVNN